LKEYGKIGLRTLLLAEKDLDDSYFNKWSEDYKKALTLFEGREEAMNIL
jgi:hypothetical protein